MPTAIDALLTAQKHAFSIRPKVGGFPYLAEALRLAGISRNLWSLPSCQSIYITTLGPVVIPGIPLVDAPANVPHFDKQALIRALRRDQAGEGTFPEFLKSAWEAGVIGYDVDFEKRHVTYYGVLEESYREDYPAVAVK